MLTSKIISGVGKRSRFFIHRHVYAILLMLFSLVLIYQTFYITHVVDVLRSLTTISRAPFSYSNSRVITSVMPEALAAGLRPGNTVEKINNREFSGHRVLLN